MRFLTLNTHSWLEEEAHGKFDIVVDNIIKHNYDIICLQEVNQRVLSEKAQVPDTYIDLESLPSLHVDNYALRLVKKLAELGLVYYWSWAFNHIAYDEYHEGVALLSKTPISARALLVSNTSDENDYHTRRVLLSETTIEGNIMTVASLHLSWWNKGFQTEWSHLESVLTQVNTPLVLLGDFNNPTDQKGYHTILNSKLGLMDSHKRALNIVGDYTIYDDIDGWEDNQCALKVDHIFYSDEIRGMLSRIVFDGVLEPKVSDHCGLEVELEWN